MKEAYQKATEEKEETVPKQAQPSREKVVEEVNVNVFAK